VAGRILKKVSRRVKTRAKPADRHFRAATSVFIYDMRRKSLRRMIHFEFQEAAHDASV
jgi:hypothetical protein